MIRMNSERGDHEAITAPIIVCDHCQEEITDCIAANLLWLPENPERQYHTHKHCNRAFEHRRPELFFYWMPLDHFLDFVGHNSGLSHAQAARRQRESLLQSLRRRAAVARSRGKHARAESESASTLVAKSSTHVEKRAG